MFEVIATLTSAIPLNFNGIEIISPFLLVSRHTGSLKIFFVSARCCPRQIYEPHAVRRRCFITRAREHRFFVNTTLSWLSSDCFEQSTYASIHAGITIICARSYQVATEFHAYLLLIFKATPVFIYCQRIIASACCQPYALPQHCRFATFVALLKQPHTYFRHANITERQPPLFIHHSPKSMPLAFIVKAYI